MDNTVIRLILGMKVRQLRLKRDLSLQALGKKTGMSASYLNEIEKGKKYPKADKIMMMAGALEVDYDELISLKVSQDLGDLAAIMRSPLIRKFPFELFGVSAEDLVQLMARVPRKTGLLARMLEEMAHNYDMRVEHFFHTALRCYQILNNNFFADIEKRADGFREQHGWGRDRLISFGELRTILTSRYEVTAEVVELEQHSLLSHMRSVLTDNNRLLLHAGLSNPRRTFAVGRELGFRLLGLKERAFSSPSLEVGTFEEVLNNFRASYFAGSLLLPRERMRRDLKNFFKQPTWDAAAFIEMMDRYQVTPETFFYRLSELAPRFYKTMRIHFLKFTKERGSGIVELTKQLNMSNVHIPHGIGLKEHFCRRWLSLKVMDRMESGDEPVVGVQRSRFLEYGSEFFCISISYPSGLTPNRLHSVTIGFQVDDDLKRTIKFLGDPAIPRQELGQTCERCPLKPEACHERKAAASLYESQRFLKQQKEALAELRVGQDL